MDEPTDSNSATDEPTDSNLVLDEPTDSNPATDEPTDSNPATGEADDSKPVTREPVAKPIPLMELQVTKPVMKLGALMDIPINPFWLQSQPGPEWGYDDDLYETDDNFQQFYNPHKPFRGQPIHRPDTNKYMNPYEGPSWSDDETEDYPDINESDPCEFPTQHFMGQPMNRRPLTDQPFGARPLLGQPIRRRPSEDRQINRSRPYPQPPVAQRSPADSRKSNKSPSGKPVSLMDLNLTPSWKSQSSGNWY